MSPYLPITADEITEHALGAAEAGASILHLHARDPDNGHPSALPEHFMPFLTRIKQHSDAVLNITTGGSAIMTLDDRLASALTAEPEMCSLNMGSMNFALYPATKRITDWKYAWEKPFLQGTDDMVFKNTPRDIEHILTQIGEIRGARFEFECYDVSHLYMLRHFVDRGMVKTPLYIQFVFGVLGGIGTHPENLMHMKLIADKLFGDTYMFSVLAAGRNQIPLATMAATLGGHVRVGLEDSLMIARGQLAKTNAEQVIKIRHIVEELGRKVATPDEVRDMLGLKGSNMTAI